MIGPLFVLFLVFLLPLAVYCLLLALINRRPQPLMVRGLWDCIGMLFASGGFLLVVAPVSLNMFYRKLAGREPLDDPDYLRAMSALLTQQWGVTLLYFLLLVTGVGILLWWRWNKTIIYNVDAERFDAVLHHTLTRLGFEVARAGNQLMIGRTPALSEEITELSAPDEEVVVTQAPPRMPGKALLLVEPFAPMGNVTLHWFTERESLRDEIEDALNKNLAGATLYDNPAGTWFLGIAGAIFSLIFIVALVIVLGVYFPPRGR